MMHAKGNFALLAAIVVSVNVAGLIWIHHDLTKLPTPTVRVVAAQPTSNVDGADRFTLVFDRDLVPPSSVGQVDPAGLFILQPACPGRWAWARPDVLEYRLDRRLPPGRVFRIRPTDELVSRTGRVLEGHTELRFQTSPLAAQSCLLHAVSPTDVTIELKFNQPVEPGELLRRLAVYDAEAADDPPAREAPDAVPVVPAVAEPQAPRGRLLGAAVCLTQAPDRVLLVRAQRRGARAIHIVLDKDLVGYQAELPLGKTAVFRLEASPVFSLLSAGADEPGLAEDVTVRLRFSHCLSARQELPALAVEPAVEHVSAYRSGSELVLNGPFRPAEEYRIRVPRTLAADNGEVLRNDVDVAVAIPKRAPGVRFEHRRGVLSPAGNLTLDLKVANVPALKLTARRVHANNIAAHLAGAPWEATARQVLDRTIRLDLPPHQARTLAVDLRSLLGDARGTYSIRAAATRPRWLSDTATVAVTDLAITTKRCREGLFVWVTSLRTGRCVPDAHVKAISCNNQVLAEGRTDQHGVKLLCLRDDHPDGPAWVVTAEKGDDLSYLIPQDNQWVLDDVDHTGRAYPETYEALLYTERGVYRPGDTVHLTAVLRDRDGSVPPAFPLSVKVFRPDGREVGDLLARPIEAGQGVFHAELATREDCQTGRYGFQARLPGSKAVLGSVDALVEAFVPVRMEVKATPAAERFGPGRTPVFDVSARYLWDEPAAHLPASARAVYRPIGFACGAFREYTFGADDPREAVCVEGLDGDLDDRGGRRVEVALPQTLAPGLYRLSFTATVTEPGGRSVSDAAAAMVDTLGSHVGLLLPAGQIIRPGEPAELRWVHVARDDQPAPPGPMTLKLLRVDWETVVKLVDGRRVWQSNEVTSEVHARQVDPGPQGRGSLRITCPDVGMYRAVLTAERSGSSAAARFYVSEPGGRQGVPRSKPERLEIVLDRKAYLPGETAKVLVRSPLAGTMLLSLETDRVLHWQVAQVEGNTAELSLDLPDDLRGGAFVTASVVRPVDPARQQWLPHRAMGAAPLRINSAGRKIDLSITSPDRALPGRKLSVTVDAGKGSDARHRPVVHLWAVDEGILLAAAYRTPRPGEFFLAPRRPGVATADLFFRLLPDVRRPEGMARIGAGADDEAFEVGELRRNPVPTRRREPAVVWLAAAPVGADGRITLDVQMPDLVGEMRLMATAFDGDRYGCAQRAVTLTAPLIVEATWPRFAAPGDAFEVPVKLFNSADRPLAVRVEVEPEGPVEVDADAALDCVRIDPGRPVVHFLRVRAVNLGPAAVRVVAREIDTGGDPLTASCDAAFPVRPAGALHCEVSLSALDAGKRLVMPLSETIVRGAGRLTVRVSPRPSVQLAPALESLIGYPYGCVEQTTSKLFCLLYAPQILPGEDRARAVGGMVRAGIARLQSMQTRSGGLSYWPGGSEPCLWGTAYAAACLLEAKAAGYPLDERFIADLAKYLESRLNARDGPDAPDDNTRALICRVLAVFGRAAHGWTALLAERKDKLDLAARAHLAAAFHALGRRDQALAVLPAQPAGATVAVATTGRLTGPARQYAVLLSVLLEIDPDNPMVAGLVRLLGGERRNGDWGTTLGNAAAVAALSRYQAASDKQPADYAGHIRVGDRSAAFDHTKPAELECPGAAERVEVTSTGRGRLYVALSREGPAREGVVKPYNRNLTVTRRWTDRKGKAVDPAGIRVGELVLVEVRLRGAATVGNVAVVDALPGGMEVENPRLATSAAAPDAAADLPDHVEFLDDRVVLFASADTNERVFRYALRATTAGEFILPAVQASCMYDPAAASLGPEGRVKIAR